MAVLKNAKHEAFAQGLAKGLSASDAYVAAGYKPSRHHASRLATNGNVQRRTAEIADRIAEKAEWSAADRLSSLKSIHDASLAEDRRTAIAAIAEANKMQGSYPPAEHRLAGRNGGPIQTVDLTKLSGDELAQLESIFGPLAGSGDDDAPDQAGEGA